MLFRYLDKPIAQLKIRHLAVTSPTSPGHRRGMADTHQDSDPLERCDWLGWVEGGV